jgi:CPA2 family monovalent cation:H+ antiporter-2
VQLHSVEIDKNSYVRKLRLDHIDLARFHVEVQLIRRPNMLEDIVPRGDITLAEGDVLVLLGSPQDLIAAEIYLISGQ